MNLLQLQDQMVHGKSTLAKIIMGIEKPDKGKIIFNGKDITKLTIDERANLGISFAFQQPVKFKGKSCDIWAEEEFKKNILRDKRKFDKCDELKIKLFYYIPNVSNEYLNNNEYNGIYTKDNVISNIEDILKYCK